MVADPSAGPPRPPKTLPSKLPYSQALRVAHWNVEDIRQAGVHEAIKQAMRGQQWDLLFLAETRTPTDSVFESEGFRFTLVGSPHKAGGGLVVSPW